MAPRIPTGRLTFAQEQELFRKLAAEEITTNQVIEAFLYLIPANMSRFTFQREDLYQEGVLALYSAIEKFEPERGHRFSTYASHWMRQAAFAYMYDNGATIRVPVYMRKLMNRLGRGQDPGNASPKSVDKALELLGQKTSSLIKGAPIEGDGPSEVDELTPLLHAAINALPERERRLVKQRFFQERTLASIAREEGVSLERVRQIIQRALPKLRSPQLMSLFNDETK